MQINKYEKYIIIVMVLKNKILEKMMIDRPNINNW